MRTLQPVSAISYTLTSPAYSMYMTRGRSCMHEELFCIHMKEYSMYYIVYGVIAMGSIAQRTRLQSLGYAAL